MKFAICNEIFRDWKIEDTLAFMFEARLPIRPTRFALETTALQRDYDSCWQGMPKLFKG